MHPRPLEIGGLARGIRYEERRTMDDRSTRDVGESDAQHHGALEDQREVIDGEGKETARAEKLKRFRLRAEFKTVAFEGDRTSARDRVFEGEEEIFGLVDPNKFHPFSELFAENFGVMGVADALSNHEYTAVLLPAQQESGEIRMADVKCAEQSGFARGE